MTMQKNVVSVSGGKDSTAMYLLAMERLQGDFIPVFADTGNEHEITLEYVSRLSERTGGPAIRVVRADFRQRLSAKYPDNPEYQDVAEPFLAVCLYYGYFPALNTRFCTGMLKRIPIQRKVIEPILEQGDTVLSWQGVRAAESEKRATYAETEKIAVGITAYRPLLNWSVQEVFAMHRRHGLAPNPLYKKGMSRVGCMPCVMSNKAEISQVARRYPEHVAKIRRWERLVNSISKTKIHSYFMRGAIDTVVAWARGKNLGQPDFPGFEYPAPSCQSQYGLCE